MSIPVLLLKTSLWRSRCCLFPQNPYRKVYVSLPKKNDKQLNVVFSLTIGIYEHFCFFTQINTTTTHVISSPKISIYGLFCFVASNRDRSAECLRSLSYDIHQICTSASLLKTFHRNIYVLSSLDMHELVCFSGPITRGLFHGVRLLSKNIRQNSSSIALLEITPKPSHVPPLFSQITSDRHSWLSASKLRTIFICVFSF